MDAGEVHDAVVHGAEERPAALRLMTARVRHEGTATTGAVSGVVLSRADETPVEGATLTFMRDGVTHDSRTGEDGTFELLPPQAGRYELAFASAPGFLPFAPAIGHSPLSFETRAGRRIEGVRIYMVPLVDYAGVILDADGDRVEGAEVRVLGSDTGEQRLAPLDARFRSGADGTFAFHAPDGAVLEARHPVAGAGRASVDFETQLSRRLVIRLDPDADRPSAGVIAGHVLDADGEPIAGAVVRAVYEVTTHADAGADIHPLVQTTSAPDGRFRLEGLDRGAHTVIGSAPGHATAREPGVEPDTLDATLRLEPEAVIGGVVVDPEGAPVPAFAVVVQRQVGELERRTAAVQSVFDPDGTFEAGGLEPGVYLVTAVASGRARSEPAPVTAPAEGVRLVLPEGGWLEGVVTSSSGGPLEGARVTLEGGVGEGGSTVPLTVTATTDTRGRYELSGVGDDPSSILVAAPGHHARVVSGLRVPAGEVQRVDVELTETGPDELPRIELAGIGAVLSAEGDVLVIGHVVEGGSAAEVGLGPGDLIEAIEGVPVGELGFAESIERIRGPEGSTVQLLIRRSDGNTVEMDVPRRRIRA